MSRGESQRHVRLKELALGWAAERGWTFAAAEVRVPRSGFRADVAAAAPDADGPVAAFECKQSRADLLKDAHAEREVRARLAALEERCRKLEELLREHRPELRRGEALWAEFDTWNFDALEHATYRRVLEEIARLRRRGLAGTKFSKMARWRCADRLYLVLEENLHAEAELPEDWGVLLRRGETLAVLREPRELAPTAELRTAWRRAIARKAAGPRWPAAEPDLLFPVSA